MTRWIFFLFLFQPCLYAQVDSARINSDVYRVADGVVYTYTSPLRWKEKDWVTLGGLVAGTAILTALDEPVREFWNNSETKILDRLERIGYHYGKPYSAYLFTGGFYLSGLLLKNRKLKDTGLVLATALFTSGILQTAAKEVIGRARPGTEVGPNVFKPFSNSPAYHSFPSGHATVAFTISLVVANRTQSVPLKILFYSLAGTTAMARMYSDAHWISDLAFGGALAWVCTKTADKRISNNMFRPLKRRSPLATVQVYPYPGGLSLRIGL